MIIASCGHEVKEVEDLIPIEYKSETCDAEVGFIPCTVYKVVCMECFNTFETEQYDSLYLYEHNVP